MANPLILGQAKTFEVIFQILLPNASPKPLTGYGARFVVLNRAGGTVLLSVDDTMPGDPSDLGNLDPPVMIEPEGAIGQVHVRLGADQTSTLTKSGVYDASIYLLTDPAGEVIAVASGVLTVVLVGATT